MPFIQSAIPLFQSINQSINLSSNHQPLHFFNTNRYLFPLPHPLLLDNRRPSWPVNETIGRQKGLHCAWDPRKGEKTAPQTGQSTNRPTGVNRNDMGVRASILWFNLHLFFSPVFLHFSPLFRICFHLVLSWFVMCDLVLFCFCFVLFILPLAHYKLPRPYLVLFLLCLILFCLISTCFALFCLALSRLVLSCFILSYLILSCFVLSLSCFLPYVTYFLSCHFCLFFLLYRLVSTCLFSHPTLTKHSLWPPLPLFPPCPRPMSTFL